MHQGISRKADEFIKLKSVSKLSLVRLKDLTCNTDIQCIRVMKVKYKIEDKYKKIQKTFNPPCRG